MNRLAFAVVCTLPVLGLLPACKIMPTPPDPQATAWKDAHANFRLSEKWKKNSYVNEEIVARMTPETTALRIHLHEQRGLLLHEGEHVAIDFPVSSGRKSFPTKPGSYAVIEKKKSHSSNLYGKYVDATTGDVLNSDADTSVDPLPENARYIGSPMPYFLRLTNSGLGLHVGYVPGYPASHGCIRVPRKIMPRVYELVRIGTPVEILKSVPDAVPPTASTRVAAAKPTTALSSSF